MQARRVATFLPTTLAVCCLFALVLPQPVTAQEKIQASQTVRYQIGAGTLESAINKFATQSKLQVVYSPELVAGKTSSGISGQYSPQKALALLLKDKNLVWDAVNQSMYVLRAEGEKDAKPVRQEKGLRSEQVKDGSAGESRTTDLQDIVVVGSRLGTSPVESAMPIRVITREDIDRSGAGNVAQALSYLSEISVNSTGDRSIGSNNGVGNGSSNSSTVQMRGLPRGTTLVLINGRRAGESASFTDTGQFDLSSVPLSLVERIEILPAGSSAVYGGDGLAGVVNIVLRKDANGLELRVRHAEADGYAAEQASVMWGRRWSRGGITGVLQWRKNNALVSDERSLTADADFTRFGGRDQRSYNGNPATIYSYAGCDLTMEYCDVPLEDRGNLPGLSSPFATVPGNSDGTLSPADFTNTQGQRNRVTIGRHFRSPETNYGLTVSGDFDISERLSAFGEVTYSKRHVPAQEVPLTVAGGQWRYGPDGRIPASNPFNPFGVEVGIDYEHEHTGIYRDYLQSYYRGAFGLRGKVSRFEWEVSAWHARDESKSNGGFFDQALVNAALASTDPAATINPFVGAGVAPASTEFLRTLLGKVKHEASSQTTGLTGYVRGEVFKLPAGNITALLGAERLRTSYTMESDFLIDPQSSGSSTSDALFAEARVPIIAPPEGQRWERLAATGAFRRETSDRFQNPANTETVGIEYRPFEALLLRTTYSTAFRPLLTYRAGLDLDVIDYPVQDPAFNNEEFWVAAVGGGGVPDDLRPETSKNQTIGFVYRHTDDWSLSFNYWRIKFTDQITVISVQDFVDNEASYPGRIVRDPVTNIIQSVDARSVNIALISAAGVDLGADARWDTAIGPMFASLAATYTQRYDQQRTPDAPIVGYLAKHNSSGWAPRWKIVPKFGWDYSDAFRTMLTGRFVSSYRDSATLSSGPNAGRYLTLGNFWIVDLNVDASLGTLFKRESMFADTRLSFGATNLFNRLPDFCAGCFSMGYDGSQYDIDGRTIYAEIRASF